MSSTSSPRFEPSYQFQPASAVLDQNSFATPQISAKNIKPEDFTKPFCDFMTENPTVFHAVDYFKQELSAAGYTEVSQGPMTTSPGERRADV